MRIELIGMPMIDFVMTFPCFMAGRPFARSTGGEKRRFMHQPGVPVTFNADGDECVPIFTDEDVLRRFIEHVADSMRD